MFASMFKSVFKKSNKSTEIKVNTSESDICIITKKHVEEMLTELNEINDDNPTVESINMGVDMLSINDVDTSDLMNDSGSVDNFDDTISEVSSIGENKQLTIEDPSKKKINNQINSLQCLFTWNLKPNTKKNIISQIKNEYGDYNLNISSPEFTFERFIGNLIISYELFHNGEQDEAQMKILEVGKWLEELDNGSDKFYLSIKDGVKHVMSSTFVHMLFATSLTGECKWLLDDIVSFANMESKPRAAVHAVRAAILKEYGRSTSYLKKASECAKKACDLDPKTSYWFYTYSLVLTAQRHFLLTHKSCPTEDEITAIQEAILLSNGNNTLYNYHRMILDRDTIIYKFHSMKNKNKSFLDKNLKDNKNIVQMIKTIISMEPKDPLLIVKCARTLMTLPAMVRDFTLGKKYLTKALEMASNDTVVLKAVTNTIEAYKSIDKKSKTSNLGVDLGFIVEKHRRGEDPTPHLMDLLSKYNGQDKQKILAQICSYTILFKRDLKTCVAQFLELIEQKDIPNSYLITQHFSSFVDGSKKFNLGELISNEIRLATNSSETCSEDMLFYLKALATIIETCKLQLKEVDESMRINLIRNVLNTKPSKPAILKSKITQQNETDSDNESVIDNNNKTQKYRNKKRNTKQFPKTGPKLFTNSQQPNKGPNWKNVQNKSYQTNSSNLLENRNLLKMSKFLNSSNEATFSNNSNTSVVENLRNLHTRADIESYTQRLYQNILSNSQQQFNLLNNANQSPNLGFSPQQVPYQNPPSLLDLRTQRPSLGNEPPKKHKIQNSKKK